MHFFIARLVSLLLIASIYTVSVLSLIFLFIQNHHYLRWWALLLCGPICMSCLLLFSLLIHALGKIQTQQQPSPLQRLGTWYYHSCKQLRLEYLSAFACAWLSHLHFVTGLLACCGSLIAYLSGSAGPFLNITGLMLIYLSIIVIFSLLRKKCAPQAGLDY